MDNRETRTYSVPEGFIVRCRECNYKMQTDVILVSTPFGIKVIFKCNHCGTEKESW